MFTGRASDVYHRWKIPATSYSVDLETVLRASHQISKSNVLFVLASTWLFCMTTMATLQFLTDLPLQTRSIHRYCEIHLVRTLHRNEGS